MLKKVLGLVKRAPETKQGGPKLIAFANELDVAALFSLMGMVAKASGQVTKAQIREVQSIIERQVPSTLHDLAKSSFREAKDNQPEKSIITKYAFQLYWNKAERWLESLQTLSMLMYVAFADGKYCALEEYIIDNARATLGIHTRSYWILRDTLGERLNIPIERSGPSFAGGVDWTAKTSRFQRREEQQTEAPINDEETKLKALKLLQLEEGATEKEIKESYRALVKKYHPDILQSGAASDEELKSAVALFCQIQEAYELLTSSE